jgi:hypothetical protein
MNTKSSLIAVTSLTASFVAICAAVFSVSGIAKLFAGAALSAAIMASALELGKIVSISFLYQYWTKIPKLLKTYLSVAALVLMIITSAGIYGYLSSAYAKVAATPMAMSAEVQSVAGRVQTINEDIKRKEARLNQLISLRTQQETRLDQLVSRSTTGNNTTIRTAQSSLNTADRNVTQLQNEISSLSTQRDSLNTVAITKQVEIDTNGDIGTFVYIAKVFNTDLDTVVKWFTLVIVLVFDPLAVALVIAVNFLLKQKTEDTVLPEVKLEPTPIAPPQEPYEVYVTPQQAPQIDVPEVENFERYYDLNKNGIPDWMEPGFNWDDTNKWINNPAAKLYKQQIVDKSR